jgi:hypothetical protein
MEKALLKHPRLLFATFLIVLAVAGVLLTIKLRGQSVNNNTGAGGVAGTAPYVVPAFTGSPQTITAGTHGQGIGAMAFCADSATPPNWSNCGVSNSNPSGAGDIILTYTATPSFAIIFTPGGSGVTGATGATGTGCGTLGGVLGGTCAAATFAGSPTFTGTIGLGAQTKFAINTVTFSATPVFNLALGDIQTITLTGNVTSPTTSNPLSGQRTVFNICQDGTGSRTFAWPAGFKGTMTIGSTASKCNVQEFYYDGTSYWALSVGVLNQ